jgi:hypothetical protein
MPKAKAAKSIVLVSKLKDTEVMASISRSTPDTNVIVSPSSLDHIIRIPEDNIYFF